VFEAPGIGTISSPLFLPCNVFTLVDNFMRWDIDKNGVLNNADLSTIIFLYYIAMEGDANWAQAKLYDANGDGKVDLLDIMTIFSYC